MNTIDLTRTQNDKLSRLSIGNVVIWFSYETPVAYSVPGVRGVITSDKGWSVSTRRHISTIPDRNEPIPHAEFEAGLEVLGAKLTAPTDLEKLDARAEKMYDRQASYREFAQEFDVSELRQLAELCQMKMIDGKLDGGRSYDDEVFDALAIVKGA